MVVWEKSITDGAVSDTMISIEKLLSRESWIRFMAILVVCNPRSNERTLNTHYFELL